MIETSNSLILICAQNLILIYVKHLLDFSFVFSGPLHTTEETCFQQVGSSALEGTSQAILFLKREKIPALLY
jgi:hypothetical protein